VDKSFQKRQIATIRELVTSDLEESATVMRKVIEQLTDPIAEAVEKIVDSYKAGGRVFLVGNGGSAADAQHIAAELIGRFKSERVGLPAIALTTNTSVLTALANDYGFDTIFSRQLQALANEKDILIAITTSGTSANVIKAVEMAHSKGVVVIGFTGEKGHEFSDMVDLAIVVPSSDTARIQEAHIAIGHVICHLVEELLFNESSDIHR
jgi:D-sedoheptulose 7-phosphate isomerase